MVAFVDVFTGSSPTRDSVRGPFSGAEEGEGVVESRVEGVLLEESKGELEGVELGVEVVEF